ncbi:unnamed protein product [Anisakis simplex]|uniref:Uncharacterized protein n=1 Tax=Anisakis simplex TaxID=6269 RepID=A0A3P6RLF5_ANISI|nr:unnamed protein product [Anisakis simplex]
MHAYIYVVVVTRSWNNRISVNSSEKFDMEKWKRFFNLMPLIVLLMQIGSAKFDDVEEIVVDDGYDKFKESDDNCKSTELSDLPMKIAGKSYSWITPPLDVYHFNGFDAQLSRTFIDVHLQINLTDEQTYQIYQGNNCSSMLEHYRDDQSLFGLVRYASIMRSKHLNPFGYSVLGVSTNQPYTIRVRVWAVNYIRVGVFLGAVVLFLMSASLVRNILLYYASGCFAGLIASLLIVAIIFYRFTPKRWMGVPILFGGWSLSFYLVYSIWKNFTLIMLQYQKFVMAYFATVTLISFAVCYRYGPPTDVRSHNLAQWALQLVALLLIYFSCQLAEFAYAVIALLLIWSACKTWIIYSVSKFFTTIHDVWRFFWPERRRFLTMEEYEREGEEATAKALDELRAYCSSPQANVWKITSSLSDPRRFAQFVHGSCDHVSEEESILHDLECSAQMDQLTDDSGEDEYVLEERRSRSFDSRTAAVRNPQRNDVPWSNDDRNLNIRHRRRVQHEQRLRRPQFDDSIESEDLDDSDEMPNQDGSTVPSRKQNARPRVNPALITDDSESTNSSSRLSEDD